MRGPLLVASLITLSASFSAQSPTRVEPVVRPSHQARLSREPCGMAVQTPVKTAYAVASPGGTWSAFVQETDASRVPYDQARACIRLQRRDGPARYLTIGDFRTLRVEWLDDGRTVRVLEMSEGHVKVASRTQDLTKDPSFWAGVLVVPGDELLLSGSVIREGDDGVVVKLDRLMDESKAKLDAYTSRIQLLDFVV